MFMSRFVLILVAVALLLPTLTLAKRAAPAKVEPVIHQGVRYIAPNDDGRRAYVEAWDIRANKKLWDLTVFTNRIDPNLEEDVQHVFIKTLNVRDGTLIVTSERGNTYRIDLKTKAVTQSEQPDTALEPAVRAEILALENQWATAIERQDAAAFERLAAEDFRFIEEDGQVLNRAQYIAARSHNPENVESAVQGEIEIRQYGDAAIATGYSTIRGTRGSVPFVSRFRWTDVYVRRAGRWQAVSAQLTPLPQ
jgi:ketosteroid isomerase-like protein